MRRQGLFWGSVILLLGALLLLQTLGVFSFNVWGVFWALFLIFLGVWFLVRSRQRGSQVAVESLSIPRDSAMQASIEFHFGAGKLIVDALTSGDALLEGSFGGGVQHSVQPGAHTQVKLKNEPGPQAPHWVWEEGMRWDVHLAQGLQLDLQFHTGAGENDIDLTNLDVKTLLLKTGVSSSRVILPARTQFTRVDVQAGVASVNLTVPQGVAARIHTEVGLTGLNIDTIRFPKTGDTYESPGYDSAPNRVEISAKSGISSLEIR